MKVKISEKDVSKAVKDYLEIKKYLWIRNNTGAAVFENKGKKRFFHFGSVGSPDFLCWINGKSYGIEIKGSDGTMSEAQVKWRARFEYEGGIYILACSLDDILEKGL